MLKKVETALEYTIFWSRWLQAPIYVGLILAQVLYCYKFAKEIIHLVTITETSSETKFLLAVLTLIDIAMVANLITMVVIGGYATFVTKLNLHEGADRPDWLAHIDPGAIKIKLATSLVGISSIHLLKSFIEVGNPVPLEIGNPIPIEVGNAVQSEVGNAVSSEVGDPGQSAKPSVKKITHQDVLWQVIIHMTFVVSTLLLAITEYIMHRRYPKEAAPVAVPPDRNT
jgi:uncharacterized protein (TIGR00645 family)